MTDMVSSMSALILAYMCSAHEGWATTWTSLHKWRVWRTEKQCFALSWSRVKPTDSSCFHWITTSSSTTAWIKPVSKSPCWSCAIDCDIMYYTQTCVLTETERERDSNTEQKHMEMMHSSWSCVMAYSYTFQASLLTIWHMKHTVNMTQ